MSVFDSGVKGYVYGTVTLRVGFPVDWKDTPHIACAYCTYYSTSTRHCRLNNEVVAFPDKYVGDHCPLETERTEVT